MSRRIGKEKDELQERERVDRIGVRIWRSGRKGKGR